MKHVCYIIGAWHGEQARIVPAADDFVIAADGGYAALTALGVTPNLVMKDDTDMMLAVKLGLQRGYRNFVMLGSVGGRLDHTLANLQTLLYLAEHDARGVLYGENTVITAVRNDTLTVSGTGTISVFCLSGEAKGVTEDGLLYSLSDATMVSGYPIGVSNEFLDGPGKISVQDGSLIVLWSAEKDTLPDLIAAL